MCREVAWDAFNKASLLYLHQVTPPCAVHILHVIQTLLDLCVNMVL